MKQSMAGYDFTQPTLNLALPSGLEEISAICTLPGGSIAAVEDERGTLYIFDPDKLDPDKPDTLAKAKFGPKGDYEGLEFVGETFFVLHSDGALLELQGDIAQGTLAVRRTHELALPHEELEGIAWDPKRAALLISPKDRADSDDYKKTERPIYVFDPKSRALAQKPALVLAREALFDEAIQSGFPVPVRKTKGGKKKPDFGLGLADLAVHPITGHHYFIDGPKRLLFATTPEGRLVGAAIFPKSVAPQPEGLAFTPDGTLYLSSEAAHLDHGILLRFPWTP